VPGKIINITKINLVWDISEIIILEKELEELIAEK